MSEVPKISLCAIVGNVERYIERFLESFAPLVDEIVLIRAIGNQPADGTLDRARAWCSDSAPDKKLVTGEYHNAHHHDWPHVDHFGRARQLSFDSATNDWVIWADTDDTIDRDSVRLVSDAFVRHHDGFSAFQWDYHVPEDHITVAKARLVRRASCHWFHRVHEELRLTDETAKCMGVTGARITHQPIGTRSPNDARNLRLLGAMDQFGEMTLGHAFHHAVALVTAGQNDKAAALIQILLKDKGLGEPERYELFMMLARMSEDAPRRAQMFLQALAVDPRRREAYADLALWCYAHGRWSQMLGWTRSMLTQPMPNDYVWNLRHKVYGWAGIRVHAMALRCNGRRVQADVLQRNHFMEHGSRISLIHATRGRPRQALQAQDLWMSRAADPDAIEHIFGLDADDSSGAPLAADRCIVVPPGGGCVRAWNAAAAMSHGHVLVQMSDDWVPPVHWDRVILERIGDPAVPAVLAISDGAREDDLLCMAILTRARYQQQGWLFHPDFEAAAMFSDNYFTDRAYRDGVVIEARDIVFEHQHPAFGKGQMDATYAAQNAPEKYQKGKEIFDRLTA